MANPDPIPDGGLRVRIHRTAAMRSRRHKIETAVVWTVSVLAVVGMAAWLVAYLGGRFRSIGPVDTIARGAAEMQDPTRPAGLHLANRPVYPFSVIPGGAYNRKELADAISGDPAVARHYVGFDVASTRTVQADAKAVYVSYRRGDSIYWTSHPIRLLRGETLLTDGANVVRARCGNRISTVRPAAAVFHDPPELFREEEPLPEPPNVGVGSRGSLLAIDLFPPGIMMPQRSGPGVASAPSSAASTRFGPYPWLPSTGGLLAPFPLNPGTGLTDVPGSTPPTAPPQAGNPSPLPLQPPDPISTWLPLPPWQPTPGGGLSDGTGNGAPLPPLAPLEPFPFPTPITADGPLVPNPIWNSGWPELPRWPDIPSWDPTPILPPVVEPPGTPPPFTPLTDDPGFDLPPNPPQVDQVPEPGTMALLATALVLLEVRRRRAALRQPPLRPPARR